MLHIGLSLSPTWLSHKRKTTSTYSSNFYLDLAQRAEKAKLDFLFKPDSLYLNYQKQKHAPAYGSLDPSLLLATLANQTQSIGLVTTISTTFTPPYLIARQMQSLQWLTNGRAGWNIVTSLDGAQLFSNQPMPSTQLRYQKARQMTKLVRHLWESHRIDTAAGTENYAPVDWHDDFSDCSGVLNVPMHPSGPPVLFQAGASDTGRDFAAEVADAIFASTPSLEHAIDLRGDLIQRAKKHAIAKNPPQVLPGLYVFLAPTDAKAKALYRDTVAHIDTAQRLKILTALLGVDFSSCQLNKRITGEFLTEPLSKARSRTHSELLYRWILAEQPTLSELLNSPMVIHSGHWLAIGTPESVADTIQTWYQQKAIDGFVALPGGSSQSLDSFFKQLMPLLAAQGLSRQHYKDSYLRTHLTQTILE